MIAGIAALLLATIGSLELMRRLPLIAAFRSLGRTGGHALRLIRRTGVSEWAKERAIRLMAGRLMLASLRAGLLLVLVAMPVLLLLGLDMACDFGMLAACIDPAARLWVLGLTLLYLAGLYLAGRRSTAGSASGERLLQRIALGSPALIDTSFDIERRIHGRAATRRALGAPVFIAGLARAGTTMLLRSLHASGDFAALTYRDLPFPLAPNSWARIARAQRSVAARERGHGDGISHDLDSPEAIEEVFWRNRETGCHAQPGYLAPVPPRPETVAAFRDYVALIALRYGRYRYLSKNNNNILRLPALIAAFPDAHLVHPFRHPIQQAASLLDQHRRACALAAEDPFRTRFTTWLGHHEFGADHRPFLLPGAPRDDDPTTIDHWLRIWISTYRSLLRQPEEVQRRQTFVDYDALCARPHALAPVLGQAIDLPGFDARAMRPPERRPVGVGDHRLVEAAWRLHEELMAHSPREDATPRRSIRRHARG